MRLNHILKFFSPYFLINQATQQSGATFQIPAALKSARGPSRQYVVRLLRGAAVEFPIFNVGMHRRT
jgi:hypothetical protein